MIDVNCNLFPTKALKQHWSQESFSYLGKPRPDFGIMLVLNGQIDFVSPEAETLSVSKGNIVFLPKNAFYKAMFRIDEGKIENFLINFEADTDFGFTKPCVVAENASFHCIELFENFVNEYYSIESTNLRNKGLFILLLDYALRQKESSESASNQALNKAKTLLKTNFDMPISQIARECSVSESGLRKIFSEKTGMSPTEFRMKEKLNRAKYLLEATNMSIGEISDELSFYDGAYFCKLFRNQTGLSPKQYRKNKKL